MKSLLIKDCKILLQQKTTLLLYVGISIFMIMNGFDISFCFSYATMLVMILMLGTISYDAHENGMSFLMTLPVSRKQYVLSKYLLTVFSLLITNIVLLLLSGIYEACVHSGSSMTDQLITAVLLFFTAIIMNSLMIPVNFKYGAEKSRLVLLIIVGAVSAVFVAFSKFAKYMPSAVREFILKAADIKPTVLILIFSITALILFTISLMCAIRIIEKKDY